MPRNAHLRASDADREHVVERLHAAATEGRLSADELDERVSRALSALTYGELAAVLTDLPSPAPSRARRSGRSGHGVRGQVVDDRRRRTVGAWAFSVVRANPMLLLFVIPVVAVTGAMVIAISTVWLVMLALLSLVGLRSTRSRRGAVPGPWTLLWDGGSGRR